MMWFIYIIDTIAQLNDPSIKNLNIVRNFPLTRCRDCCTVLMYPIFSSPKINFTILINIFQKTIYKGVIKKAFFTDSIRSSFSKSRLTSYSAKSWRAQLKSISEYSLLL